MAIGPIQNQIGMESMLPSNQITQKEEGGFTKFLGNAIEDVNKLLGASDEGMNNLATGQAENLHDAMIAMEKAETAFKLLVQVRNRALDAYNDIMRMQV